MNENIYMNITKEEIISLLERCIKLSDLSIDSVKVTHEIREEVKSYLRGFDDESISYKTKANYFRVIIKRKIKILDQEKESTSQVLFNKYEVISMLNKYVFVNDEIEIDALYDYDENWQFECSKKRKQTKEKPNEIKKVLSFLGL